MNDVMPGNDDPENLKILKKSQLGVNCGRCSRTVGLSAIELSSDHNVEKLGSDYGGETLRLDHEMCGALGMLLA